jgi:hypothetical protein
MNGFWEVMSMMTQVTMVQGMGDVVHGLLFALVCGCRQVGGKIAAEDSGSHIEDRGGDGHRTSDVSTQCTTLSSGQMLLPGIAEPYRWEFSAGSGRR